MESTLTETQAQNNIFISDSGANYQNINNLSGVLGIGGGSIFGDVGHGAPSTNLTSSAASNGVGNTSTAKSTGGGGGYGGGGCYAGGNPGQTNVGAGGNGLVIIEW